MRTYFRDGRWRTQTMTSVIRERAELRMHRAEREGRRSSHGVRRELGEPPFVQDLREKYYVGDDWITLELVANDGRERWAVYDKDEMVHAHVWGREAAELKARELGERVVTAPKQRKINNRYETTPEFLDRSGK